MEFTFVEFDRIFVFKQVGNTGMFEKQVTVTSRYLEDFGLTKVTIVDENILIGMMNDHQI